MCVLISQYLGKRPSVQWDSINYKFQELVDESGNVIGYEALINAKGIPSSFRDKIYTHELAFPNSTKNLVERLLNKSSEQHAYLSNKYLFINIERSHLCDQFLLCDIVLLSQHLDTIGCSLVVETTERNRCGQCPEILKGLNFLKGNSILLALDDYDLLSDFRADEACSGLYDFMKVEYNIDNLFELGKLKHVDNLIVERIESEKDKQSVLSQNITPWAFQGYLFNTIELSV